MIGFCLFAFLAAVITAFVTAFFVSEYMKKAATVTAVSGVIAVVAIISFGIFGVPINYSDGDRAGIVTKISRKGVIFKTWEGQMMLGGSTTAQANTWDFTVPGGSPHIAEIQAASLNGQRVQIHYDQPFWAGYIRSESGYFVTGVGMAPEAGK